MQWNDDGRDEVKAQRNEKKKKVNEFNMWKSNSKREICTWVEIDKQFSV